MRFTIIFLVALRALRRNTMRSILTALGIIIGIGAVITIVSMGNGAKARVEAQVAALGQNIITVYPGSFSSGGMRGGFGSSATLTVEDADAILAEVSDIDGVSPEVRDRQQVLANGLNWNTSINGESPDYPYIKNWNIVQGSMFTEQDVKSLAKVAVIGKTVADQLFPNEDPVGQTLRIRNLPFRIVGVLDTKGFTIFGSDQDDVVIIPYTSHMRRVSRRTSISAILVQGSAPDKLDLVKQRIEDFYPAPQGSGTRFHRPYPGRNCGHGDRDLQDDDAAAGWHRRRLVDRRRHRSDEHHARIGHRAYA